MSSSPDRSASRESDDAESSTPKRRKRPRPGLKSYGWDDGWPLMNDGYVYQNDIKHEKDGIGTLRVFDFYREKYAAFASADEWKARIIANQITLNGSLVKINDDADVSLIFSSDDSRVPNDQILRRGDQLRYRRLPWEEPGDSPSHFGILFEDSDILVIDKPSG